MKGAWEIRVKSLREVYCYKEEYMVTYLNSNHLIPNIEGCKNIWMMLKYSNLNNFSPVYITVVLYSSMFLFSAN